jgi:para-nitrobenzyl esterase
VIALLFGSLWPGVVAQYPLANYRSPDLAFSALMTDWVFSCQTRDANDALAGYVPTYSYEFADEKAPEDFLPRVSFRYGSTHASELQFIWDVFVHPKPVQLSQREHVLADQMVTYWTQFAATGNPDGSGAPHWPQYHRKPDDVNSLITPAPVVVHGFAKDHQCEFWRKYPPANIACVIAGNCQGGSSPGLMTPTTR